MDQELEEALQAIADDVKMVLRANGYPDARWSPEDGGIVFYDEGSSHDVVVAVEWC